MELEEARGNHVIRDEEVSSADISSSSEVISQHLVSYRNIEELQQQNQRLLVALRELGETREREEQETTSSKLLWFIQQTFIENFLCALNNTGYWKYSDLGEKK